MLASRLQHELKMLASDPPFGVACWPKDDAQGLRYLEADIVGPEDTPYEGGVFRVNVFIPDRYPFEPPKLRFATPVLHVNIDSGGRVCLDTLKMPPKGTWGPALNVPTVLAMVRQLLAHPNADDGLEPDTVQLYKRDLGKFNATARAMTKKHAMRNDAPTAAALGAVRATSSSSSSSSSASSSSSSSTSSSASSTIDAPPAKRQKIAPADAAVKDTAKSSCGTRVDTDDDDGGGSDSDEGSDSGSDTSTSNSSGSSSESGSDCSSVPGHG